MLVARRARRPQARDLSKIGLPQEVGALLACAYLVYPFTWIFIGIMPVFGHITPLCPLRPTYPKLRPSMTPISVLPTISPPSHTWRPDLTAWLGTFMRLCSCSSRP